MVKKGVQKQLNIKKSELEWHQRLGEEVGRYEEFSEYDYRRYIDHFIAETGITPDDLILELGCGTGAFTSRLSNMGYTVVGLDISDKMLLNARNISQNLYVQGDMELLPFTEDAFDVVFASVSLHHLPGLYRCAREAYRVLKKRGRFFSLDPNRLNPLGWVEMNVSFAGKVIREKCLGYTQLTPNERYFTEEEVKRIFREAGFKRTKTYTINFLPFKRTTGLRKVERMMEKIPILKRLGGTIVHCSTKI